MNAKIVDFDKQAKDYAATELATVNTGGIAEFNRLYRDKFAELIIQECSNLCYRYQNIPATEPRHCANDIRSMFGIKPPEDDHSESLFAIDEQGRTTSILLRKKTNERK